jgi:signal transduction histidine kinase
VINRLASRAGLTRSPAGQNPVPPVVIGVQLLVLIVVVVTVPLAQPAIGVGARGVAIAVTLGVCIAAWVFWLVGRAHENVTLPALIVMGAAGGALAGLSPLSTAIAAGAVATSSAGARLPPDRSVGIAAETVAAFLIAGLITGAPAEALLGIPLTFIGLWAFGLTRHAYLLRAEQAEQMLAETRRAHEAETEAAALAERARIAREIHDVLAHTLAAVSVNLQAAEGLLAELPDERPELGKAVECIGRAGVFTREGMAEARRAILALRDNAEPLPDQLAALAREFSADGDAPVDFTVTGTPRPVTAEASLAAYRSAQEMLPNARKHAPGQPVRLCLEYMLSDIAVQAENPLPGGDEPSPLAGVGAGYGLAGLRERAALGGGDLNAGPADGRWQVRMRIPA